MKPIDGIDLGVLVEQDEIERIAEQKREISKQIRAISNNVFSWRHMIETKEKEIASLKAKVAGGIDKLAKISAGDWAALQEQKPDSKPNSDIE